MAEDSVDGRMEGLEGLEGLVGLEGWSNHRGPSLNCSSPLRVIMNELVV